MGNILLTNIGNRNLYFELDGNYYLFDKLSILLKEKNINKSFRKLTQEYFENQWFDKVKLNILNSAIQEIVNKQSQELSHIFIFASDIKDLRNDQDTIYEAEIIKELLARDYPNIKVEIMVVDNVTDNNHLLKTYKNYVREIFNSYEFTTAYICDAGGTGQQKSSLKIISEFLINDSKYLKIVEVEQVEYGKSKVDIHSNSEYKKIITAYQVERLIEQGNYGGAASILGNVDKNLKRFLEFMHNRLDLIPDQASSTLKNLIDSFSNSNKVDAKIREFFNCYDFYLKNECETDFPLTKVVSAKNAFLLYERLQAAQFFLNLNNYNRAIHLLAVFVEMVVSATIQELSNDQFKLTDNYSYASQKIVNQIKSTPELLEKWQEIYELNNPDWQQADGGQIVITPSLPALIFFLKYGIKNPSNTEILNHLLELIEDSNSFYLKVNHKQNENNTLGLDRIRNPFAHEARGITQKNISETFPPFNEWSTKLFTLCHMNNLESNVYLNANKNIINLFLK